MEPSTSNNGSNTSMIEDTTISLNNKPSYRYLQKLTIGLAKAKHHSEFLRNSLQKGHTPQGLRINTSPQLPTIEGTFTIEWNTIVEDTQKFMEVLTNYWQRYISTILKNKSVRPIVTWGQTPTNQKLGSSESPNSNYRSPLD